MSEESALPPQTSEHYGRYRLRNQLASGGMATVYVAQLDGAAGFGKLVALKRIHAHLAKESEFVRMFLDEARIASRVNHANVCTVTDFGEEAGTYFLAMELLLGETFSKVLRTSIEHEVLPQERARFFVKLLADACEGLHAAHDLKDDVGEPMLVVHRDISPQNLFVTHDGIAKVLDFGIAKARHRLQDETVGQIKGKYAYMAPEQVRGGELDRRADIWALGVVAWELLTGKRLFRRPTEMETMFAVLSDPIEAPSSLCEGLPVALDAVVLRALEREPSNRYATAREFGSALLKAMPNAPSLAEVAEWMQQRFPDASAAWPVLEQHTPRAPKSPTPIEAVDREAATAAARLPPRVATSLHTPEPQAIDADARPLDLPATPRADAERSTTRRTLFAALGLGLAASLGLAIYTLTPSSMAVPAQDLSALPVEPDSARDAAESADAAPPHDAATAREDAVASLDAGASRNALEPRHVGERARPAAIEAPVAATPNPISEPTAEPPPHVEAAGEGSLCFRVAPDGPRIEEALVDGQSRRTIGCGSPLPAGPHEVELRFADGTRATRRVEVPAAGRVSLAVPFE